MSSEKHSVVSYRTFTIIWVALMFLTVVTVWVTGLNLGHFSVGVALVVATVKAALVLAYFMHLKFDDKILAIFLGLTLLVFVAFIVLTYIDYILR